MTSRAKGRCTRNQRSQPPKNWDWKPKSPSHSFEVLGILAGRVELVNYGRWSSGEHSADLPPWALLFVAIGCSATSPAEVAPTPNIEATVEARVQATSEAAAAIKATAGHLEECNRVERACLMHSSHLENRSEFATSLVLLEFSQEDQAILRRTFGNLTSLAQKAIMGQCCQFKAMEPIINFFPNQDIETAFRSF